MEQLTKIIETIEYISQIMLHKIISVKRVYVKSDALGTSFVYLTYLVAFERRVNFLKV